MKPKPRISTAERFGRWLGRSWRGCLCWLALLFVFQSETLVWIAGHSSIQENGDLMILWKST